MMKSTLKRQGTGTRKEQKGNITGDLVDVVGEEKKEVPLMSGA